MLVLFTAAVAAGERPNECGSRPAVESIALPRLTKAEAMAIAVAAAQADGHKLSEFEAPWFCFDSKENEWTVFFDGRAVAGRKPAGHHFMAEIHDRTKQSHVVPGA